MYVLEHYNTIIHCKTLELLKETDAVHKERSQLARDRAQLEEEREDLEERLQEARKNMTRFLDTLETYHIGALISSNSSEKFADRLPQDPVVIE